MLWAAPTCSVELFSAVLGRLEDRGFSEVSEREEGLLEGTGDSGWWRSDWPDTAAGAEKHNKAVDFQPVFQCGSAPVSRGSVCESRLAAAEVHTPPDSLGKVCIIWGL